MPDDATDLSYWVTQNLPLDDSLRLHLLSINNAIQRLRCALSMIIKVTGPRGVLLEPNIIDFTIAEKGVL